MYSRRVFIALAAIVLLIAILPAPAAAADRVDACNDAPLTNATGTNSGTVDSTDDTDSFNILLSEGERVDFSALVPPAEDSFEVEISTGTDMSVSYKNVTNAQRFDINNYPTYREGINEFTGGLEGTWELWAEDSGVVTVTLSDSRSASVPYEWEFNTIETPVKYTDNYPESYSSANRVDATGTYQGRITTPGDSDSINVLLEEGDTLYAQSVVPSAQGGFSVDIEELNTAQVSLDNVTNAESYQYGYPSYDTGVDGFTGGFPATYEIHAEASGAIALTFSDGRDATVPYTWSTTLQKNEPIEQNSAPSASISVEPARPTVGESVTFNATDSTDADGTISEYRWDVDGDGTTDRTSTTAIIDTTYSQAGTYNVTLIVVDDDDATASATSTVTVEEAAGPTVVGNQPATDPDGDGKFEDVNGDGTFNIVDVNTLFRNRNSDTVQSDPESLDFNNDGVVNIVDVSRLFSDV